MKILCPLLLASGHSPETCERCQKVQRKLDALASLKDALTDATESGLFDDMVCDVHPDVINQFCDMVDEHTPREGI